MADNTNTIVSRTQQLECHLKRGSNKIWRQLMTIDGKKREVTEPPKLQAGERGGNLSYVKDVILLLI